MCFFHKLDSEEAITSEARYGCYRYKCVCWDFLKLALRVLFLASKTIYIVLYTFFRTYDETTLIR